jgi:hypothetical protein
VPDKEIDLTGMSAKELQQVHNQVLRALATRVRTAGGTTVADYDRHSSGHSRSGGGITRIPEEVTATAAPRRTTGTNR